MVSLIDSRKFLVFYLLIIGLLSFVIGVTSAREPATPKDEGFSGVNLKTVS